MDGRTTALIAVPRLTGKTTRSIADGSFQNQVRVSKSSERIPIPSVASVDRWVLPWFVGTAIEQRRAGLSFVVKNASTSIKLERIASTSFRFGRYGGG